MTSATALIARREIVSRLQQRGYRIGLALALAVVVIGVVLPAFFGGGSKRSHYDIGLATSSPDLASALTTVGRADRAEIAVHRADPETARAKVRSGTWDAAVLPGGRLVSEHRGDPVVGVVQSAYRLATTIDRLHSAGLDTTRAMQALSVAPLRVEPTTSGASTQKQTIAFLSVVLLFSQLIAFCTWVAMGVVEEKASRVVELMLAAVRPLQLLTGKLVGIGLLAAVQVLAIAGAALVAATAAGTLTVPASAVVTLVVGFAGFLLGYAFFAALAAALASTVSRQEEVSGVLMPVTLTLTVCYAASFAAVSKPDSTLARLVSVVPPFSAIAMPARIARASVSALDIALAVVLLVAAAAAIIVVAARIYRASILHAGTRVPLRRAWRGEAVGNLS